MSTINYKHIIVTLSLTTCSVSVLIGIAALLLQKLCFDTVDFIPFVAPCALEVATQRSETTLVTAEPLRLMPSLVGS